MAKPSVIKRKKNPGFIIPLILALMVTFMFYQGAQKKVSAEVKPIQVPIAKVDLSQHTQIKADDIGMVTIPIKGLPPNVITDPKQIEGKYVATKYTIPQNGYFLKTAVSELSDIPSRISMQLGPNHLGVTLQVNLEKSVANSLIEGQYVQVRWFTNKTPSNQPFEGILFDKLKILALRNSAGVDVINTDTNVPDDDKIQHKNQVPTIVVFEATDEQVSYLIRSQNLGSLNLVAINQPPSEDIDNDNSSKNIEDILALTEKTLTSEQYAVLQNELLRNNAINDGEGHIYKKNAAQLLIDSMSYTIQKLFEENEILVTSNGEFVYYDVVTNKIKYFKDKTEYEGSVFALSQLTPDRIEELKQSGKLTDAQIQALTAQLQGEPQYYETAKGEIFQIVNGQAIFFTNDEVIKMLTELKQKNGRLSAGNQALLEKLSPASQSEDESISNANMDNKDSKNN
jgi:Flp pilus assembly protein CpaB